MNRRIVEKNDMEDEKMINIFLDDLREPPEDYILVKTVEECIEKAEK